MFFKLTELKKLLKEAYKSPGLTLARTARADAYGEAREGLYPGGGYWEMWMDLGTMPKEVKAAVIELCGDIPDPEQAFTAEKGMGNQYELEHHRYVDLTDRAVAAGEEFTVSSLILKKKKDSVRILQHERTNKITLVDEKILNLIDETTIREEDGEMEPFGPISPDEKGVELYWWNHHCCLMVMSIRKRDEEMEYLRRLEQWPVI